MKLYTVWSGEYSDVCLHAIFQSKEKAQKYIEVYNALEEYEDYYMREYELADNNFNINTEVSRYYYASICCVDNTYEKAGDIETDWCWDSFMEEYGIESYEELDPKKYGPLLSNVGREIIDTEELYNVSTMKKIGNKDVIIEKFSGSNGLDSIYVYSKKSYAHARKIAIEQFQIWQQGQLEKGLFTSEDIPLDSIEDKYYLPGDDIV